MYPGDFVWKIGKAPKKSSRRLITFFWLHGRLGLWAGGNCLSVSLDRVSSTTDKALCEQAGAVGSLASQMPETFVEKTQGPMTSVKEAGQAHSVGWEAGRPYPHLGKDKT